MRSFGWRGARYGKSSQVCLRDKALSINKKNVREDYAASTKRRPLKEMFARTTRRQPKKNHDSPEGRKLVNHTKTLTKGGLRPVVSWSLS